MQVPEQAFYAFSGLMNVARPVAFAMARELKKYGWTPEDCEQEAAIKVWTLVLVSDRQGPYTDNYVKQCVRNHLRDQARTVRRHGELPDQETNPDTMSKQPDEFIRGWTKTEWDDMMIAAPERVAEYLQARVVEGLPWADMRVRLSCSGETLIFLRRTAAWFLMDQLEGRKHGD